MKNFDDIYNSVDPDFKPRFRSLKEIGIILSKLFDFVKLNDQKEVFILANSESPFYVSRTTIARLIHEIETIKTIDGVFYTVENEGLERAIKIIKRIEDFANNDLREIAHFSKNSVSSDLKVPLSFIIDIARRGIIFTRKKIIADELSKIPTKQDKINYINSKIVHLKQNEILWDEKEYNEIIKHLELEKERWENHIEINSNELPIFNTCGDLHNFIINLINDTLCHNIKYEEGYRVFWRDEACNSQPKNENEIHPFIKSLLKPHCDTKKVSITRENVIANGRIDMTFTYLDFKICLEVKKAQHPDILTAINTQLSEYMYGEKTRNGIYLILWYKSVRGFNEPKKYDNIDDLKSKLNINDQNLNIQIIGIDCTKPISPSKIKASGNKGCA